MINNKKLNQMSKYYIISPAKLTLKDINDIIFNNKKIKLSDDSVSNIKKSKAYLNAKLAESDKPFYGINTGFGALYDVKISKRDLTKLQENLVMSHACGTGDKVPEVIVKTDAFTKD